MSDLKDEWETEHSTENRSLQTEEVTWRINESETMTGRLLDGRFQIEKDLTESGADVGGMGVVYLARDLKLMGRKVVVKILQKRASENEDIARKFLHEREALIRLDHPNIVRILDSGELSDGAPFMVMEYIPGYSLRGAMNENGQLSFDMAGHIIESISSALSAAHAKKIIHRDIKPENIMLTPQDGAPDRVRLIDFGIARVEESLLAPVTTTSRGIGTVRYIAPEQLAGTLEQNPTVDIYSFGIVIYEMLTGERPFNPESEVEMYVLQQRGVGTPPSVLRADLSLGVEKLLLSALEFEPAVRPQDIRLFGRSVVAAMRGDALDPSSVGQKLEPTIFARIQMPQLTPHPDHGSSVTSFRDVAAAGNYDKKPSGRLKKLLFWSILALLALSALVIPAGIAIWKSRNPTTADLTGAAPVKSDTVPVNANAPVSATPRELKYFLNVQKYLNKNPSGSPFVSNGRDIFESGWKFKMVFESKNDGYLYLYNEGPDKYGNVGYNLLFPTPKINAGMAAISANKQTETAAGEFNGGPGSEIMWVIWTRDNLPDLESVKDSGVRGNGSVKDIHKIKILTDFLLKNIVSKTVSTDDPANQTTVISGNGDIVINKFELKHR